MLQLSFPLIRQRFYNTIKYTNCIGYHELLILQCIGSATKHKYGRLDSIYATTQKITYSQPVTRFTGEFNLRKHRFCISALISAPTPAVIPASWTMTSRPVRLTLSKTVSTSHGRIERRSISSTLAERIDAGTRGASEGSGVASICRAVSQWYTGVPQVRSVRSEPGTRVSAFPRGSSKSSVGTCSTR